SSLGIQEVLLAWFPVILSLLCTATSVSIFLGRKFHADSTLASFPRDKMHTLRRPSHFIGFDQIHHATPPDPAQFLNFPILIAQVDHTEPRKVFPDNI
ncbi:hypothetical protein BT96DRAFT_1081592, partial [Gymnopus androsaceus JB14]